VSRTREKNQLRDRNQNKTRERSQSREKGDYLQAAVGLRVKGVSEAASLEKRSHARTREKKSETPLFCPFILRRMKLPKIKYIDFCLPFLEALPNLVNWKQSPKQIKEKI
jgi:hypothetical protein